MLKEITSYLEESEDESEEVKEEAERLIQAIEKRKGKTRKEEHEMRVSRVQRRGTRPAPIIVDDPVEGLRTPPSTNCGTGEMLDYALELHRKFSAKKVPELRDLCSSEGIVWTKHKTAIGDLLRCRMKLGFEGTPSHLCALYDLPRTGGHVKARLEEIPGIPTFMKNSRNVTSGYEVSVEHLEQYLGCSLKAWTGTANLKISREDGLKCLTNRGFKDSQAMTCREVSRWVDTLEKLVRVPIDRNPGATLVICPVLYLHACKMTFNKNHSFIPVPETEMQILSKMKDEYRRRELGSTAMWGAGGRIGQAYVLPKDKDLDRWRPISPAVHDPARLAGARLGRAIRYMLLDFKGIYHFDLKATYSLRSRCEQIQEQFRRSGMDAIARSYDIKHIFARLSHHAVMESVRWLVRYHEDRGLVGVQELEGEDMCYDKGQMKARWIRFHVVQDD
ncbi:hypothetical protein CBR_g60864 [Chara braunii]|uniref:Uncharacterized protein n=1 Tax=Chara braunii TaxID=69332 RepID=A0A388MFG5_CHABU|nr:hypothetical protein CBR_g60864 [Chara braunii]|eukprot:GBG93222.1 hypothetical protein CBR_g60864 [Chara braunii]